MKWLFYITIFLLLLVNITNAQTESEAKLEIVNADTSRVLKTDRGALLELVGNVHLKQGDAEMFCGRAQYWKQNREAIAHDQVKVYDKGKSLFADKVFYYDISQVFKAVGKVVFKDSIRQLSAKQVSYFKSEDRVEADYNVVMKDSVNHIDIYGQHAEFDNNKDYALVTGSPLFVKNDSTGKEELRITSIKMELFERGDRAVATDSVHITQNNAIATCGRAEFYRKKNEILLDQNPVAWQGGDRLSGESIHLFIKNNQLVKAIVNNQALVTSRVDTTGTDNRINILTGQQITMYFENEELQEVLVENEASSYYYIYEDNEAKGLNKIIGDKIRVFIKDRQIERILVESNPQVSSGTYYPPGKEPVQEGMKN